MDYCWVVSSPSREVINQKAATCLVSCSGDSHMTVRKERASSRGNEANVSGDHGGWDSHVLLGRGGGVEGTLWEGVRWLEVKR